MAVHNDVFHKNLNKLLSKGRCVMLAYDHGLEHGPSDFSGKNSDPSFILDVASKAHLNAIIFQKGIAEQYYKKSSGVPLVVKLNGKTNLVNGEPLSRQLCSVSEASDLGACAVGYTVYLGSAHESIMLQEFGKIEEEAHNQGLPVIAWMYPRGKSVKRLTPKVISYAARAGLELGADFVKTNYTGDVDSFKRVVEAAGKCKILALGGLKKSHTELIKEAQEVVASGASGLAVGRNVWQHPKPLSIARIIRSVVIDKKPLTRLNKQISELRE